VRGLWELLGLIMGPQWNGMPIAGLVELAIVGTVSLVGLRPLQASAPKRWPCVGLAG
jgi:hypothetical protein